MGLRFPDAEELMARGEKMARPGWAGESAVKIDGETVIVSADGSTEPYSPSEEDKTAEDWDYLRSMQTPAPPPGGDSSGA